MRDTLAAAFAHAMSETEELPEGLAKEGAKAALLSWERLAREALAERLARSEATTAPVSPEARRVQGGVETQDRINPWKAPER